MYFSYNKAIRSREEAEKESMEDSIAEISAMDAVHQHIISSSDEIFKVIDPKKFTSKNYLILTYINRLMLLVSLKN